MDLILNLTQHPASQEQLAAGVRPLDETDPDAPQSFDRLRELLTFEEIPTQAEVIERAEQIAALADYEASLLSGDYFMRVMIGGAPFLMEPLARALRAKCLAPVYAFSKRESKEVVQPDGSVKKVAVFRHLGFVGAD